MGWVDPPTKSVDDAFGLATYNILKGDLEHLKNELAGTYAPTLTGIDNVAAVSAGNAPFQYLRAGDIVSVSGSLSIDPTASATPTSVGISLPIASDLAFSGQLNGIGASNPDGALEQFGVIAGDTTNNRAQLGFAAASTDNKLWHVQFMYLIV